VEAAAQTSGYLSASERRHYLPVSDDIACRRGTMAGQDDGGWEDSGGYNTRRQMTASFEHEGSGIAVQLA
jgi:hypothetical protein